jgi:hypothetical protein
MEVSVVPSKSAGALVLILLASCVGQDKRSIDPTWAATVIGTLLNRAQLSGSLEYSGRCYNSGSSSDFPKMQMLASKDVPPAQLLSEMFADDSRMQVTLEVGGKIRMVEIQVPQDLLNLKITHISFTVHPDSPNAIGSATEALWTVLETSEVKDFMKAHHIGPIMPDVFGFSLPISPDGPYISGDLNNVSVAQILDYILQTYPGFWTYENCQEKDGSRTVFFGFFPRVPPGIVKFP